MELPGINLMYDISNFRVSGDTYCLRLAARHIPTLFF